MLQLHLDKDVIIGIYVTQIVQNLAQSLCDTAHLPFLGSRYETCYSYAKFLIYILNAVPDLNVTQNMFKRSCHVGEYLLKYCRPNPSKIYPVGLVCRMSIRSVCYNPYVKRPRGLSVKILVLYAYRSWRKIQIY